MHAPLELSSAADLRCYNLAHRHGDALVLAAFGLVALLLTGLAVYVGAGRGQDGGGNRIAGISDDLSNLPAVVLP